MARIIAVANQKGGVGKTTTSVNLAASLAIAEQRTLLIDADPQANASSGVGLPRSTERASLYDVIVEGRPAEEVVVRDVELPFLATLPSSQDLVGAELELVGLPDRETRLRKALAAIEGSYDFILIDCPPSLGLITLNVLTAARGVLIPIQCEYYALEGLGQLMNTIKLVQKHLNPSLEIEGVLLTMFDSRLNLSRQVSDEVRKHFDNKVYSTVITRNVRLSEAPSFGKPIILYDIMSTGAENYMALTKEVLAR